MPIGFASFDENPAADTIGLAGFVFGYKEHEESVCAWRSQARSLEWLCLLLLVVCLLLLAPRGSPLAARPLRADPPSAWLLFSSVLILVLALERYPLRAKHWMDVPSATCWLVVWTALAASFGLGLWLVRGWRQSTLYSVCFMLNGMLSGDNLVVFMLLLQQAGLDTCHHVTAISHGMLLALGVRILLSLAGSILLQRFSWLLLCFAAFLLLTGLKMLCVDEAVVLPGAPGSGESGRGGSDDDGVRSKASAKVDASGDGSDMLAVRCIGTCVPLYWSDATGGKYVARDPSGRLSATRMAVCVFGICLSDVLFAMDSVPVILSLTTSPFVLVASQTMSLLWLRPVYFLLAALASYMDSMQQALAVVLVLISLKIFLEAAGFEVPIAAFLGVLVGWRVLVVLFALMRKRGKSRGGRRGGGGSGGAEVDDVDVEEYVVYDGGSGGPGGGARR